MSLLSIDPPDLPLDNVARPPGSKSHTIRALFAAAMAHGKSTLAGALDSEDTRHARRCLGTLGARIADTGENWLVAGVSAAPVAPGGPLHAGESGLTARFLLGLSPFVPGPVEITGSGRLPQRPMGELLDNLASRGALVLEGYPWRLDASGAHRHGTMTVAASTSSQMVSSLLLAAPLADRATEIAIEGMTSSAQYVEMTVEVMRAFGAGVEAIPRGYRVEPGGYTGTEYRVPTDASAMVYPACAAALTGGRVQIIGDHGAHPDTRIFQALGQMGCRVESEPGRITVQGPDRLRPVEIDMSSAPDAAVSLAIVCARASGRSRLDGLGSLRLKESDRIEALRRELTTYGADVTVVGDSLEIGPGVATRARLATHNDHRIAMALGLLGLVSPGISIEAPNVVEKTWPGYWEWLASTGATMESV